MMGKNNKEQRGHVRKKEEEGERTSARKGEGGRTS